MTGAEAAGGTDMKPQYLGYSDFTGDLNISYTDYLQARQFSDSIEYQISQQTKDLITQSDRIGKYMVKSIDAHSQSVAFNVEIPIAELKSSIDDNFKALNSVLEWGFSEILLNQTRTNDLLKDILAAINNPSSRWAVEQFGLARDAFRRGLFKSAIKLVTNAIEGHGSNVGLETEHRFHFLLGVIRLGSYQNFDPEVVSLSEAEKSFLRTAECARHDDPLEAADAYMFAGRAALLDSQPLRAIDHLQMALSFHSTPSFHYELARAYSAVFNTDLTAEHLYRALWQGGVDLLTRALGDPAFTEDMKVLVLHQLRRETKAYTQRLVNKIRGEVSHANELTFSSGCLGKRYKLSQVCQDAILKLKEFADESENINDKDGIADTWSQISKVVDIELIRGRMGDNFSANIQADLRKYIEGEQRAKSAKSAAHDKRITRFEEIPPIVAFIPALISLMAINHVYSNVENDPAFREGSALFIAIIMFVVLGIVSLAFGAVIWAIANKFRLPSVAQDTNEFHRLADKHIKEAKSEIDQLGQSSLYHSKHALRADAPDWLR